MRMLLQELSKSFAQDPHAAAVDHANAWQAGKECPVDELLDFSRGIVNSVTDNIDFRGYVRVFAVQRNRYALCTRRIDRSVGSADDHFGDIFARDPHLHGANFDLKVLVVNFAHNLRVAADRLELHDIAFGNMLDQLRRGIGITAVRTANVSDDSGIKLLAKVAA